MIIIDNPGGRPPTTAAETPLHPLTAAFRHDENQHTWIDRPTDIHPPTPRLRPSSPPLVEADIKEPLVMFIASL